MLDYLIDYIDLVLIMSVNPGFGGQSFIQGQLRKIEAVRKMIEKSGRDIRLEVDGGIDAGTAPLAIAEGAAVLLAGTAPFKGGPDAYADNSRLLPGAWWVAGVKYERVSLRQSVCVYVYSFVVPGTYKKK